MWIHLIEIQVTVQELYGRNVAWYGRLQQHVVAPEDRDGPHMDRMDRDLCGLYGPRTVQAVHERERRTGRGARKTVGGAVHLGRTDRSTPPSRLRLRFHRYLCVCIDISSEGHRSDLGRSGQPSDRRAAVTRASTTDATWKRAGIPREREGSLRSAIERIQARVAAARAPPGFVKARSHRRRVLSAPCLGSEQDTICRPRRTVPMDASFRWNTLQKQPTTVGASKHAIAKRGTSERARSAT